MKILKNLILISFFFCSTFTAKAEVEFYKFQIPDIKNDFCGKQIAFQYCKCAWHNIESYCDSVGMDQSTATNYVVGLYNQYVDRCRKSEWDVCINNRDNAYWDTAADGCVICNRPHVLVDEKRCEHIENLCSGDLRVMYSDDNGCFCPKYFRWDKAERACIEVPEVELKVEYEEVLPLFADGQTEVEFKVTLLDAESGGSKKVEEFKVNSSMGYTAGTIISTEGDEKNGYTVKYKTPDLRNENTIKSEDFLAVFYINSEEEKAYTTFPIALAVGDPFIVNKKGFVENDDVVVFASKNANVKVVTESGGTKVPVQGATVLIQGEIVGEKTNAEGVAELEKDDAPDGDEVTEVEVVLELTEEVKKYQKDAQDHYGTASSAPINAGNATVSEFINNFAEKLAKTEDDDEAAKAISGLRRTAYACFFISKGGELADDAAANIGKAIDTQIGDVISLLDPITALTDKISSGLKGKYANKEAVKKVTEKLSAFSGKFVGKLSNMLKGAIKTYAPSFDADALVGMFTSIIPDAESLHETNVKNPGEDALKGALSVEKKVTEYFMDQYKTEANAMLATIASQITTNNFDPAFGGTELGIAKDNFVELMDKYLEAHEIEYNTTMTKAYVQFGFDTIGNAISYTTAYGKLVEGAQKVYDIAKAAYFNNKVIYTWFETYGVLTREVTQSVNKAVGIAMGEPYNHKVASSSFVLPVALADEIADAEKLSEYYATAGTYGIFADLKEIGDLMLELEPDNEELKTIVENLDQDIQETKAKIEELEPEVAGFITEEEKAELKGDAITENTTSLNITEDQYMIIAIASGFCVLLLAIIIIAKRKKK